MDELALAIETSNPSSGGQAGVALGWLRAVGVELIAEEPLGAGERHDDQLMPAIERLMLRAGFEPAALHVIVCSIGPGGYTGLRIATAAANMIALATGARLVAVPSAWVAAVGAAAEGPFAVALASKGETSHVTVFSANGEEQSPGRVVHAQEIPGLGVRLLLGDHYLPASFRDVCTREGIEVRGPEFSAAGCLGLARMGRSVSVGELVPEYGREAEAVTKWRELHPKRGDRPVSGGS